MKPILPRPLLWTEIETMDEFLRGDFLNEVLYRTFKGLNGGIFLPYVNEVSFFNELYYQLTRYYYEKPTSSDYARYVAEIRTDLGKVCYVDLVLTMMYHYRRLKNPIFLVNNDGFMRTIRFNQENNEYWHHFTIISSSVTRWLDLVPFPQKPCPVNPKKLVKRGLDWKKITHEFDLKIIKGILALWEKTEDREVVAMLIKEDCGADSFLSKQKTIEYRPVIDYLEEVTGEKREEKDSSEYIRTLKQDIEELKEKLSKEEDLNRKRIDEINRWHDESEDNLSRVYEWESKYEEEVEKNKKAEYVKEELEKVKQENVNLRVKIEQLKEKQDEDGIIVATAKRYKGDKHLTHDIILKRFVKDEEYKKKEKLLENKIKELQDKLGEETVPLSMLAEGIKNYSEEAGIDAAYDLFSKLNDVLIEVPAWTKNVPDLKNFFRKARKDMEKGNIVQGDYVVTKNVDNEVNSVASGATGISVKKE